MSGRGGRGGGRGGYGDRGGRGGGRGGGGGGGGYGPKPIKVYQDPSLALGNPDAAGKAIEDGLMKSAKGIVNAMSSVSLTQQMPLRPGFGTQGRPIRVYANYFKVNVRKDLSLTRYSVEVTPEATGKKLQRIFELLLEMPELAGLATDWRSFIVSARQLQIPNDTVYDIPYRADGEDEPLAKAKVYKVRVVTPLTYSISDYVNYLCSMDPAARYDTHQEVMQVVNAVFGHHTRADKTVASIGANRSFSLVKNPATQHNFMILGGGLEAIRGYFRSVRPASGGLLLNVNTTHGTFFEAVPLVQLYSRIGDNNKPNLAKHLGRVRVEVTHIAPKKNKAGVVTPRIKTIYGLADPTTGKQEEHPPKIAKFGAGPKEVQFWLSAPPPDAKPAPKGKAGAALPSNAYMTVFDYFSKKYPAIRLDPRHSVVNVGNRERPMFLPAEVCNVAPGNTVNRRLSPQQTQQMITFACRQPWENAESITGDGATVLGLKPSINARSQQLGLEVQRGLLVVSARVLQAPQIMYKTQSKGMHKENPRGGSWNMANIMFHTGANIGRWTYIDFTGGRNPGIHPTVMNFKAFMLKSGINSNGYVVDPAPVSVQLSGDENRDKETIKVWFKRFSANAEKRPNFVFCVLPAASVPVYNAIKTIADTKAGIHTVCVVQNKFMKEMRQEQYFANICLKFNLKAGGINHTLDPSKLGIISEGNTMVVGLDVTHPSPGSKEGAPSVAAIVASVDKQLGQWPSAFKIQEGRKEMVTAIEELFLGRLKVYQKKNATRLPQNIIMYRDGVSEGQFHQVLEAELPGIRNACRQVYSAELTKKGFPKISIIVCGKRHHTRFYPTEEGLADKTSNCQPGTVVDRGVTEARNWDFFLQPHACLQGSARPCHYYVILDEIFRGQKPKLPMNTADSLEDLTHNMCHLFGRATKAVSLCPPAYYADLLCTRVRCYMARQFDPITDAESVVSTDDGSDPEIPERLRDTMYYI